MQHKKLAPIWRSLKPPYTVGLADFKYSDLPRNRSQWFTLDFCYPLHFDLVDLETTNGIKKGWYTGNGWDGYRMEPDDKVLRWKRREDNITSG